MSWPNPFRRHDENTRDAWGHIFQWTSEHMTPEQYNPLKYSYDELGEECLEILNTISPPPVKKPVNLDDEKERQGETNKDSTHEDKRDEKVANPPKRDLYVLLRDHRGEHAKLAELWDEVTTIPDWVDWEQIARGQEVFYRYGGANLTGLAFQSLLGGMGANRVVEVLARTGGFSTKVARHRLFETTQHILECTRSLESIQPLGAGFASSVRVRLLHAAVRQRIMKLTKTHPSYYSVEKYGVPINDLDCIATIAAFSSTLVFLALPRQGLFLRQKEIEDYIALWRLIALYTGTPTSYFATPTLAKATMESLVLHEIDPSETSKILANNVIRALEKTPPAYASREFLEVSARWLNGPRLSDALDIGRPSWYYYVLMGGQCLFFMALCYTYRSIPALDRRKVAGLRKIFWHVIIESKEFGLGGVTGFEFKHLPDLGKSTEKEDSGLADVGLLRGVERRNLTTIVVAGVMMGGMAWIGLKVGLWTLGKVV